LDLSSASLLPPVHLPLSRRVGRKGGVSSQHPRSPPTNRRRIEDGGPQALEPQLKDAATRQGRVLLPPLFAIAVTFPIAFAVAVAFAIAVVIPPPVAIAVAIPRPLPHHGS